MAHQPPRTLFNFLGLVSWGDIADLTIYRNKRGKLVWLKKTWPDKPPSPTQIIQRDRLIAAATDWRRLTRDQQQQWHTAARRASLSMHGYTLFVSFHMRPDPRALQTLARQTSTTLTIP